MTTVLHKEQTYQVAENSTAADFAKTVHPSNFSQIVGVSVNGVLKDLSTVLAPNDDIRFIFLDDPEGREIFLHSSAHLLAQAVLRLWPQAQPTIGPVIEQGFYYDFANVSISELDFPKIEAVMAEIVAESLSIRREVFSNKVEASQAFPNNPFKKELIAELSEDSSITGYRQGEFFDLCRGPHLPSTKLIKAFKLLKTSAAYWRGDPSKASLVRVYGISFPTTKELRAHLQFLEEAKKRDHRVLGSRLDLFSQQDFSPGMPFFHPRGMIVWDALIQFWKDLHKNAGYLQIKTPQLLNRKLWEISGHWENYSENMYTLSIDNDDYAIKPMNCPGCMLYYKTSLHSYRDFPLRVAEIGHVHRQEASGALSGLMRVRSFHQDDAHVFLTTEQVENETLAILQLVEKLYGTFGLDYHLELSTKPEKSTIGSDEIWELATQALTRALQSCGKEFKISPGEGAFYGPKIDIHVKDAIGRTWQCGTIQLDMFLPERFDLNYTDSEGKKQVPIMLHRALFGSIERFLGILIEHFKGRFPLWLSPEQVRIVTVADRHADFGKIVLQKLHEQNIIATLDDSNESVSKKIRNAQNMQVNYMLTLGDKECENQTISIRTRDNRVIGEKNLEEFISVISLERDNKSLHALI
ncbi:threonine--tRNA ligase [Chlamydiifrater volucris]|uniref:threonine--tRNA ligase n=1 Tax=Chlamydiifrater volucris TaxID=2681470 RepID=UPI001BCEC280|nr:threonine--tRNA ligase [Chlamydiifrater volucris]